MIVTYDLEKLPDVATYIAGLKAIRPRMRAEHLRILQAQYYAPRHTASATELAKAAGISGGHVVVNGLYGKLGHMFCDETGFVPELRPDDTARWWAVWSVGHNTSDRGFLWEMREQVIAALAALGWIEGAPILEEAYREDVEKRTAQSLRSSQEERWRRLATASPYPQAIRILRTEFQRNPDVTATVLLSADGRCDFCQSPAPFVRAADGTPYLEVHHIIALSAGGEDTVRNTVALCPNCHRKVHHGGDKERHNQQMQAIAAKRGSA